MSAAEGYGPVVQVFRPHRGPGPVHAYVDREQRAWCGVRPQFRHDSLAGTAVFAAIAWWKHVGPGIRAWAGAKVRALAASRLAPSAR